MAPTKNDHHHHLVPSTTDLDETTVVHSGCISDPSTGAMINPLYHTTAFKQFSVDRYGESGYTYSRCSNPTVSHLETKVGELEGCSNPAIIFGSGMAAVNALFLSILSKGDHVVITRCSYGGTNRALRVLYCERLGIEASFVDFTDLPAIRQAIKPGKTRLVFSETPCNPVLQLADLQAISDLVQSFNKHHDDDHQQENIREAGSGPCRDFLQNRILHVADTTMSPPVMTRGLKFGVDILLLSLTKFYCGHNLNTGGALLSNDPKIASLIRFYQNVLGSIMHAPVAHQILQTSMTLHIRTIKQSSNAMKIAQFLEDHPAVLRVVYPGLKSHPQHHLALKQHTNGIHGSMIALEVKGGSEAGKRVMNRCTHPWTLAENLGAIQSIMTCPSVFTHANMTPEARLLAGITDGLIRLSVGIESADDLIASLDHALKGALE